MCDNNELNDELDMTEEDPNDPMLKAMKEIVEDLENMTPEEYEDMLMGYLRDADPDGENKSDDLLIAEANSKVPGEDCTLPIATRARKYYAEKENCYFLFAYPNGRLDFEVGSGYCINLNAELDYWEVVCLLDKGFFELSDFEIKDDSWRTITMEDLEYVNKPETPRIFVFNWGKEE